MKQNNKVNYFIRGLDPEIARRVKVRKPETLTYAINKAEVENSVVSTVETKRKAKEEDENRALINLLRKINTNEKNISSLLEKQKGSLNFLGISTGNRWNNRQTNLYNNIIIFKKTLITLIFLYSVKIWKSLKKC